MLKNLNIYTQKFVQILFLVFISTYLCLAPSLNLLAYDSKRMVAVILVSLALLISLLNFGKKKYYAFFIFALNTKIKLISIILLMLFSCFFAANQLTAFLETSFYIGLFFFCLILCKIVRDQNQIVTLFFFITFHTAALLYLTNFFTAFLASFIENIPLLWPEPFSGFSNVRFFNQYQICSITLLSLPILLYPTLDKRLINLLKFIAIGWAILLFASGSRGAILSVMLAMILTLCVFKNHAKAFLKLNTLILLTGLIIYLILFKLIPFYFDNQVTMDWRPSDSFVRTNNRIALWQFAIQYIKDNPWLGIGPMHYAYYPGPTNAHPHNSLLQWACEMGIPSTVLLISLVFSALVAWVKKFYRLNKENKQYAPPHLWIALFCSICSGLIYSVVSGVIVMPLSQIMMTLIAGWMLGLYFQDKAQKPATQLQNISFKLFAGATLITLTYTILPSLLPRLTDYSGLLDHNYTTIAPRFWQIGGIPH